MIQTNSTWFPLRRLVAVAALLVASAAHADEYGEVGQLIRSGKAAEAIAKADQYLASKPRDAQLRGERTTRSRASRG